MTPSLRAFLLWNFLLILASHGQGSQANVCRDDPSFRDALGYDCSSWRRLDCTHLLGGVYAGAYTANDAREVRRHCPSTCCLCHGIDNNMVATVDRALDTAAPRLAQALRAVQRSHWAAASHHRAVGDAALLYARAVAVARTIGVASSMATARMGAVAAYRVAAALGDRSFSTFDSLRRDLQATTAKSAIALAEVGQHERAAKMLRQAIFMSPGTETQKASSRILGWSMHHLNRYDEATEAFSSSAAWNYFRIAGSLNDEDSGCDIDVAYLPHQLVGGEVWFADYLREIAQHVGRSERCTELFAGAGFIGFALLAFGLCNSLVVADIAPEAMARRAMMPPPC